MDDLADILRPAERDLRRVEELIKDWLSSYHEAVHELERYSVTTKGKRIRPALIVLSGAVAGQLVEKNYQLAAAAELIHMATLAHDDVVDRADLRRGRASINAAWGNHVAVLFGDYLLSQAFTILSDFKEDGTMPAMVHMTRKVCEGEIYQLRRRFDIGMSEDDYKTMVSLKTASLFSTCCRQSASIAGAPKAAQESIGRFGESFGMAYQIIDDCLDINGREDGKDRLKDIEGGRVTLPLIKALNKLPDETRDRLALAFREGNVERCLDAILSTAALDSSLRDADDLMKSARDDLSGLPDNQFRQALSHLTHFVMESARG